MVEGELTSLLFQYGILGIWTLTLLRDRHETGKIQKAERAEHVEVIRDVSTNLALMNDNVKQMSQIILGCQARNN